MEARTLLEKRTSTELDEETWARGKRQQRPRSNCFLLSGFVICFLITSNVYTLWQWHRASHNTCIRPKLSYSPAKSVIHYEKKRLIRDLDNNVFTGESRNEFDQAWHNLLSPMVIKITDEDLRALNETSLALKDGSGYIAELAVYHELHCIKRLRRHLQPEIYYPNMTEAEQTRESKHVDHCLEYWREAAMCRGDTTLSTFRWDEGIPKSTQYSDHECINWNSLDSWARQRSVEIHDYSILTKDVVGPHT